jgi:hypothetical protein
MPTLRWPAPPIKLGIQVLEDIIQLKIKLHRQYLDPLWRFATRSACYKDARRYPKVRADITKRARERTYEWIAFKTGRQLDDVHVRYLNEPQCLEVIALLQDIDYDTIRKWAVARDRRNKRRREREAQQ